MKIKKTNVMRILDQHKVDYEPRCYESTGAISGMEVATVLEQDPNQVFKTLVAIGHTKEHYVFMIPVNCELNLKKAAAAVGEKSIEMIKSKELLPLTGYVHGGCSPIGMKKPFRTIVHETAQQFDTIMFSAGKIGYQVQVSPRDLGKVVDIAFADVAEKE